MFVKLYHCCVYFRSPIKVLQAAKTGTGLPNFGGQEGISQVFQQLAGSFMAQGVYHTVIVCVLQKEMKKTNFKILCKFNN